MLLLKLMSFILLAIIILFLGPQLWVEWQLKKHSKYRPDLPGTGGELVRHLLDRFKLTHVRVALCQPKCDCYDAEIQTVYLSPENFDGKSISAVAIAAHEVGHTLQHASKHPGFIKRNRRIKLALIIERFSVLALMIAPISFLIAKVPQSMYISLCLGGLGMIVMLAVHLLNLPIEFDASFNKALPILAEGYVNSKDLKAVHKLLQAAAFTYVATALASFLNVSRWIAILRK